LILHGINHIMRLSIVCIDCAYAFTPVTEGILFIELRNDDGKCWQILMANVVHQWNDGMEIISIVCMVDYESHHIGFTASVLLSKIGM
jgi:hypothetical protein